MMTRASNIPSLDSIKRNLKLLYNQKLSSDVDKVRNSGDDAKAKEIEEKHALEDTFDLVCM
jgi:hypothetical protein